MSIEGPKGSDTCSDLTQLAATDAARYACNENFRYMLIYCVQRLCIEQNSGASLKRVLLKEGRPWPILRNKVETADMTSTRPRAARDGPDIPRTGTGNPSRAPVTSRDADGPIRFSQHPHARAKTRGTVRRSVGWRAGESAQRPLTITLTSSTPPPSNGRSSLSIKNSQADSATAVGIILQCLFVAAAASAETRTCTPPLRPTMPFCVSRPRHRRLR